MTMLTQVERVTTTQAIVGQLIELIRSGRLKPGDKLPSEPELVQMLGVGRSSIREAKQTLLAMNLIDAHPGRGSFVKAIGADAAINADMIALLLTGEHILALHEAREMLEVTIAALAAARATEDDLAVMARTLQALEGSIVAGASVYDPGLEFHRALVEAAQNPVLARLYGVIMSLLQEYQRPVYETHSDPQAELDHHRRIFESVAARDGNLAQATMRMHLQYVLETTRKGMPELFAEKECA
jgi:GntR family transcriptional regulator, transcriptional repressor for pyruvate dehydrogenase complex